jgi:hypothetical protein
LPCRKRLRTGLRVSVPGGSASARPRRVPVLIQHVLRLVACHVVKAAKHARQLQAEHGQSAAGRLAPLAGKHNWAVRKRRVRNLRRSGVR